MRVIQQGEKFNHWTLIKEAKPHGFNKRWLARCQCGTKRVVFLNSLRYGKSRCCGCIKRHKSESEASFTIRDVLTEGFL